MFVRMSGRLWASFAVNRSANKTLLWIKLSESKKKKKSTNEVYKKSIFKGIDYDFGSKREPIVFLLLGFGPKDVSRTF